MSELPVSTAGLALLLLMLKASVILGLAAAIDRLVRHRTSAAMRHGLWTVAVTGVLALPLLAASLPAWPVRVPIQIDATAPLTVARPLAPALPADSAATLNVSSANIDSAAAPVASTPSRPMLSWTAIALGIYATGLLLFLARLVVEQVTARRLVASASAVDDQAWKALLAECATQLGVGRTVWLRRTAQPLMPMAVGIRKPVILLSDAADSWTEERRRAVLLHELAHIVRRDCLTQTIGSFATALYWIHPGVWWAARRLQVEREFACDDRVLAAGAPAGHYANDLLEIAYTLRTRRSPTLAVTMARRGQLEGRLLAVLDAARNRATPGMRGRIATVLSAIAVIVPVATIGVTTYAASPLVIEENLPVSGSAAELAPPGVTRQSSYSAPKTPPKRLGPSLYAWADLIQGALSTSGSWSMSPADKPGEVYLEMRQAHSSSGTTIPLSRLEGLTSAQITAGGTVRFTLRRDAGAFTFEGILRDGGGGGAFAFAPNPGFADELAKRGIARPTPAEQYQMAKHDVGLALVDDLRAQGYQTPTVQELVQAGHHGVNTTYVREMGQLGYKVGTIAVLIKMRDHGVTPDFVQGLATAGLTRLSADDLVRARDHGVTPDFAQELKALGYGSVGLDALVTARDHGVTGDYVKGMSDLGYSKLTLDELRNARDHGVTADYVRELQGLGYKPELRELVNARDHGVTPDYVKELRDLGYRLPLGDLVMLRDHGATADRVKRANERAGTKLPPDMLRSVMDGGMR